MCPRAMLPNPAGQCMSGFFVLAVRGRWGQIWVSQHCLAKADKAVTLERAVVG